MTKALDAIQGSQDGLGAQTRRSRIGVVMIMRIVECGENATWKTKLNLAERWLSSGLLVLELILTLKF
ncbi:hypothetical protein L596_000096 [Steinernema carpocapsae]|uniref:Uncharacterized protein n=1 Tax=Steinernema carpocapsae TaxID=34508 RepID=A0A4U8UJ89_STECR|nr:hypothetical protein L596_000096 [Steinernema carpocapsae]